MQTQGSTELTEIVGTRWEVYQPTDFSYLFVHYTSQAEQYIPGWEDNLVPGTGCQRYFLIPINWVGQPVPADQKSWGEIKGKFDEDK
jgi:hypothetical protein